MRVCVQVTEMSRSLAASLAKFSPDLNCIICFCAGVFVHHRTKVLSCAPQSADIMKFNLCAGYKARGELWAYVSGDAN